MSVQAWSASRGYAVHIDYDLLLASDVQTPHSSMHYFHRDKVVLLNACYIHKDFNMQL